MHVLKPEPKKKHFTGEKKKYTESTYKHRKKYLYIFIYIIAIPGNGRQVCTKKLSLEVEKGTTENPSKQTNGTDFSYEKGPTGRV